MKSLRNPIRLIPLLFAGFIAAGTVALMLPFATTSGESASLVTAFFTATSAVSVTGLIVADTETYWSGAGQVIILLLFQIGGLGIMTAATLFGLMAGRGFGLRQRMATQVERNRLVSGDATGALRRILMVTLVVEATVALILTIRFASTYDRSIGRAIWDGAFHSISAFNNAGFSTLSDNVMSFQSDPVVLVPIMFAVILAALGFPVMEDIRKHGLAWRSYSLHSKMTLSGTAWLLVLGFAAILVLEWSNADTLGPMAVGTKMLNAAFHSVMPRTAGFNSLDMGEFRHSTLMINYLLMFIGGGSAGTAGGIKITTFVVLIAIVVSEIRQRRDPVLFSRRMGTGVQRQALTVATLAAFLVTGTATYILAITNLPLRDVLFETISAFSTVGLSTGITADLPPSALVLLAVLMFVGRVGTITAATALTLRGPPPRHRYPEENPIVG